MRRTLKNEAEQRQEIERLFPGGLAPMEHLLRKIDAAADFTRIYESADSLQREGNDRLSHDSAALFKLTRTREHSRARLCGAIAFNGNYRFLRRCRIVHFGR